jgi:hypothetical protein
MKSPARRFTLVMLAASALFVGGPALLNYVVDPYDRYGNNRMGVYISAEREAKATEVARYPHNALLVGNSRLAMIPASEVKGFRFFNGAFAGATAEEAWWFIHHFAQKQDLVVLGIDLGMMDPVPVKGDIFRQNDWASAIENLVNLETVQYSFRTMGSHWAGIPSHLRADGTFEIQGWMEKADIENPALLQAQIELLKRHFGSFVPPTPAQMSFYRKISETLRERGIACVVVMPPMHEAVTRHIEAMHLQDAYREWLRGVKALFPNVVDLTSGPYSSAASFYKSDAGHFKPEVGVRFMNEEVLPVALKAVRERAK